MRLEVKERESVGNVLCLNELTAMAGLSQYEEVITLMYENGHTDAEISHRLSELGMQRGNSRRSIRKFRSERGLKRASISNEELELVVTQALVEVS